MKKLTLAVFKTAAIPTAVLLGGCVGFPMDGYAAGDPYGSGGGYQDGGRYAPAYDPYPSQPAGGVVRCESDDNRTRECATYGGRARLVRQLSKTQCVEGRNWGYTRDGVWVSNGCRAEFVADAGRGRGRGGGYRDGYRGERDGYRDGYRGQREGYGGSGQMVQCESVDRRVRRCPARIRSGVQLVRKLSDTHCTEGQTWGWDRDAVWVSGGCRAQFSVR